MREPVAELIATDPEGMRALGARLARALATHACSEPIVVGLDGDLGAGKTTLVSGLLHALGVQGATRSPTYTLIEPYTVIVPDTLGSLDIYHIDLYRLADPDEVDALGLRDLLVPRSVLLIEWPSRGEGRLPALDLTVAIRYEEQPSAPRCVQWIAGTPIGAKLVRDVLADQPQQDAVSP